jgi:protein-disulfide isomerase
VVAAIRADLAALWARSGRTALVAAAALALVALAAAAYPRYWERPPPRVGPPGAQGLPGAGPPPGAAPGPLTIVEYSDYACPFCARAHEEMRSLLAGRPEIALVRRHFPLDPSCNPAVKRAIHPSACALARAGICAEEQGRFAEMDDALFGNQREGAPLEALAARVGLDRERFRACLAAPSTAERLAADVSEGIRAGVRATPSYLVGGLVHAGRLPPELFTAQRPPPGGTGRK